LIIGSVEFELYLPGVNSLKEKRGRIKSAITRIRNKFNVSIAEVGLNDTIRSARIGMAIVSSDKKFVDSVINKVALIFETEPEMNLTDYQVEIL